MGVSEEMGTTKLAKIREKKERGWGGRGVHGLLTAKYHHCQVCPPLA